MELPSFLIEMLNNQYGSSLASSIIDGYSVLKKTSFRVNTLKSNEFEVLKNLKNNGFQINKGDFANSYYTDNEYISSTKEFKEGYLYLQNFSSMLPPIILNPIKSKDILDMAAAPGSKTSQLSALSNNEAHIMAVEVNKIRFERLKYNCEKLCCKNITFLNQDAKKLDDFFRFDQILLDAPCSGSGTITGDKKIKISKDLIFNSARLQNDLLKKAIGMLKPGGELVYSTCSILKQENENIINRYLKEVEVVPIEDEFISKLPLLPCDIKGAILVRPTEFYEGFFVVKLKKK